MLDRAPSVLLAFDQAGLLPYWLDLGMTGETITRALVVAVFSASMAGVLPALKVTGAQVQGSIQRAQAHRSGIRFGGITSALIVADVAIAVAVVGLRVGLSGQVRDAIDAEERVGIPAEEYLSVELTLPSAESVTTGSEFSADQFVARLAIIQQRLVERLEAEPRVRSVAVADRLPRQDHNFRRIAIEGETSWVTVEGRPGASSPPLMPVAQIDLDFFEALGQPILAGRGFGQADLEDGVSTVIVNTAFADRRLAGRNAIGQRIRFFPEERLYEIAGVVGPLGMNVVTPGQDAGVYLPAGPGEIHPLRLAVHLDRSPETFAPRMRELVNEVNPSAVVRETIVLDRVFQSSWYLYVGTTVALGVLLGILVALAASGIYAMMSFAVSERTRETGIRTALGAQKAAIAYRLGRRSIAQVGLGALFGVPLAVWLFRLTDLGYGYSTTGTGFGVAFGAGVGVTVVIGLLACLSPMRRALKIQPTEALRDEA